MIALASIWGRVARMLKTLAQQGPTALQPWLQRASPTVAQTGQESPRWTIFTMPSRSETRMLTLVESLRPALSMWR